MNKGNGDHPQSIVDGERRIWIELSNHQTWQTIYNSQMATLTIHIETEESSAAALMKKAEKTYCMALKNIEDYPRGLNMTEVKGSAKALLVTKLATYQKTNEQMISFATWYGDIALDKSLSKT